MNLKDFLENRDKPPELYWSLVIEPHWVQAGIWYIGETTAEVVGVSPGAAWETEDELLGAADAALSSSVQQLPEDYKEPNKTVFGVPSSWVKGGEISEEFLARIKTICTELSLTPVGFVVLPEAIAHLYKSEEGSPLSAVVIGLGREMMEISVFKLGNLVGTTEVSRSVSITEDVIEGLTRFGGAEPLPSRIIIYDGKGGELEEAKESLLSATWEESKVKFLHTPKVEIFPAERKVIATSLAGANEIGHVSKVGEKYEETPSEENVEIPTEEVENVSKPDENLTPEKLGFAIGEDVNVQSEFSKPPEEVKPAPQPNVPVEQAPLIDRENYFQKTKTLFHNFSKKITGRAQHFSVTPKSGKPLLTGAIALALLAVAGALFWWFVPKATVTVYVSPKNFQQEVNLNFATDGKSDPANGIIPAVALSAQESGDKTKATTGTKLIGNKSTGSVQISNGNPSSINLATGTFLTSSAGLKFVTSSEASVSGQVLPGSPGTATVNVTASDIGAQYNLAKGEIFSVGNFSKSLVAATSQADFSGGSSQEISAVAASDQTNLETDLKNELQDKAKSDLMAKVTTDQIFVDDVAGSTVTSENFDQKVGDQADNLKLSLAINVAGVAADRTKLLDYAKSILKDKIPSGFVLRDSQITFKFTFIKSSANLDNYNVQIGANFLPAVNSDQIINQIKGKTPTVTENYLDSIPGFARADVILRPNLPGLLGTLPRVAKNITINVVAE